MNTNNINWTQFDKEQTTEIREGLEKGLDVSIYARPEYNYLQMEQIRKSLQSGRAVEVV